MALARYKVVGVMPIRDAVTKEDVTTGGIVQLDDEPIERKDASGRPVTPLGATIISALVQSGCIEPIEETKKPELKAEPKAEKD